jgi:23S rRNA (adenine2503-C2)-methyltransferase
LGEPERVKGLLRGIRCKVNLIALNPGPGIQFSTPAEQSVQVFKDLLTKAGVPAFVRRRADAISMPRADS